MTTSSRSNVTMLLAIAVGAVLLACAPSANVAASPTPTITQSANPSPTATATPTAAPSATTAPATPTPTGSARPGDPTPVVLTVGGRVTQASDGRPVSGVRLRFNPAALSGGCPVACPKAPGPDVVVTSDANGAYTAKVAAWTLEALADSSSSQLSLFLTPPAGMKVVAVTQASTLPIGPIAPNVPEWYFMLARDLKGPIDITLAPQ